MKQNVKVTEKLFKAVKIMLDGGATYEEIRDYLGVSLQTCNRIKRSENYADYRNLIAAMAIKNKQYKNKASTPVETPPANHNAEVPAVKPVPAWYTENRILESIKEQNELLKSISAKLAFIVEQLS